jgi:hypothetical protein
MATVDVTFQGAVIVVHVTVNQIEIPMTQVAGDKWTGTKDIPSPLPMHAAMRFTAPSGTDWSIVIKTGGKKVVEDDGTSDDNPFKRTWDVPPKEPVVAND